MRRRRSEQPFVLLEKAALRLARCDVLLWRQRGRHLPDFGLCRVAKAREEGSTEFISIREARLDPFCGQDRIGALVIGLVERNNPEGEVIVDILVCGIDFTAMVKYRHAFLGSAENLAHRGERGGRIGTSDPTSALSI